MNPLYKANFHRHRSDPEEGPVADSETQCLKMYCNNQIRDEIRLESHTIITIITITIIISILLLLLLLLLPPPLLSNNVALSLI
jgi:competence protein ComGC